MVECPNTPTGGTAVLAGPDAADAAATGRHPRRMPVEAERLAGTLVLRDGSVVGVRAIREDDGERLRAFHARLSDHTIHLRYFAMVPRLSADLVTRLVCLDYADRMAVVATQGTGADERIVAVVRYVRCGPRTAEVAFVVEDAWQHRGVAGALFRRLVAYARARGFATLLAVTLPENQPMRALLRSAGYPLTTRWTDGTLEISLDIAAPSTREGGARVPVTPLPRGDRRDAR